MVDRCSRGVGSETDLRLLNQAGRELLLAQSSDWSFILRSGTTTELAKERVERHRAGSGRWPPSTTAKSCPKAGWRRWKQKMPCSHSSTRRLGTDQQHRHNPLVEGGQRCHLPPLREKGDG